MHSGPEAETTGDRQAEISADQRLKPQGTGMLKTQEFMRET